MSESFCFQSQVLQVEKKCFLKQPPSDVGEQKNETKVEAEVEVDVEAVSVETTELASKEVLTERSEEDAEVVSKEVTADFVGEGSLHVMPGNFSVP